MSGSKGLKRYNGVGQDDEGAYVYYDEHIAALRRAKAEVWRAAALMVARLIVEPKGVMDAGTIFTIQGMLDARAAQIEEGSDGS